MVMAMVSVISRAMETRDGVIHGYGNGDGIIKSNGDCGGVIQNHGDGGMVQGHVVIQGKAKLSSSKAMSTGRASSRSWLWRQYA
jgi:hypothetical protein